jgi:hypothetical protein
MHAPSAPPGGAIPAGASGLEVVRRLPVRVSGAAVEIVVIAHH